MGRAAACCPQFYELSGTALPGTDSGSGSDAVAGWYEFEDINRRYISSRVDNIISQLKAEQTIKEYDSYLLCSLIHGFMMHITLNIKSLAEFPGFKDDFTEIYNNFLQTLKKIP
ncbi:hypothetical protein Q4Q76_05190 [Morganella morganii]